MQATLTKYPEKGNVPTVKSRFDCVTSAYQETTDKNEPFH